MIFYQQLPPIPDKEKTFDEIKLFNKIQMKKEVVGLSQSSRMRNEILKLSQGRTAAALVKRREEKLACTLRLSQLRPSPPPSPSIGLPAGLAASAVSLFNPSVSSNSLEPLLHSPPLWLWPPLEEQLVPCSSSLYLTLLRKAALPLLLL